jgi:hypothetical protein
VVTLWGLEEDKTKLPYKVKMKHYSYYNLLKKFNGYYIMAIVLFTIWLLVLVLLPLHLRTPLATKIINFLNNPKNQWYEFLLFAFYIPFIMEGYFRLPRLIRIGIGMRKIIESELDKSLNNVKRISMIEGEFNTIKLTIKDFSKLKGTSDSLKHIFNQTKDYLKVAYLHLYFSEDTLKKNTIDHFNVMSDLLINKMNDRTFSQEFIGMLASFKQFELQGLTDEDLKAEYEKKGEEPLYIIKVFGDYGTFMSVILSIIGILVAITLHYI